MSDHGHRPWVNRLLELTGIHALVEHHHREQLRRESQHVDDDVSANWRTFLHESRFSYEFPLLVGLLAFTSAATGLYPYGPVLVAAVILAPGRWRATYIASCLGAAAGATVLTLLIQTIGDQLIAVYFPDLQQSVQWLDAERWIASYGVASLIAIAALPLPQIPALLILALAKTPPLVVGLAIFAGKICKYGAYIAAVKLILASLPRGLRRDLPHD